MLRSRSSIFYDCRRLLTTLEDAAKNKAGTKSVGEKPLAAAEVNSKASSKATIKKSYLQTKPGFYKIKKTKNTSSESLSAYLNVCVYTNQTDYAFSLLRNKKLQRLETKHCNIVLRGFAERGRVVELVRVLEFMKRRDIGLDPETYALQLLCYAELPDIDSQYVRKLLQRMLAEKIKLSSIYEVAYMNSEQRKKVNDMIMKIIPEFQDEVTSLPIDYKCKLLHGLKNVEPRPYNVAKGVDLSELASWFKYQLRVESQAVVNVKSINVIKTPREKISLYNDAWNNYVVRWREALSQALDKVNEELRIDSSKRPCISFYAYLCAIKKETLLNIMMGEIERAASFATHSMATYSLHHNLGRRIMIAHFREKSIADGSYKERLSVYRSYLDEYWTQPELMNRINPRQYIQLKTIESKNYAVLKDIYWKYEMWPNTILSTMGKLVYRLIIREVKFDPNVLKNPKQPIEAESLVNAFYTAYFQYASSHKIKEEFRSHESFQAFYEKSIAGRLKFDHSCLPSACPPLPWVSPNFGGYIVNKSDLVRVSTSHSNDLVFTNSDCMHYDNSKLYPSLDSLNALSLCPWIVNKEILNIVIKLFRSGGDKELTVPLNDCKMRENAPILKENATKADMIAYSKAKKTHEQRRKEMYSLWSDCLYRLSIANHFRDKVFWLPHNLDFRGRTYPIPPHFNHLGADLARSLLLFAKGRPLGENGLDWLKIHLINLVGKMKSSTILERLRYANSILHVDILDSADNPWDGRRWWTKNDCPWQVLACCKEIAKAIRSRDVKEYISHFPVHQDGSCNGLQHYAALGRDVEGAKAVNLVPMNRPQDIYMRVVDLVEEMRQKDEKNGNKIAESLKGIVQRKVIKQTVMTTVYGVTRYGAREQIARQLNNKGYSENLVWPASAYLVSKTFESIGRMFNKSQQIQNWFNECAATISSNYSHPVRWETPLGFPIAQPYVDQSRSAVKSMLPMLDDSSQMNIIFTKLNTSKQRSAFPPNYIHSLDSSHMMLTSLFCEKLGITFVSVHDCYWTHPSTVDIMNRVCREQFLALHSEPLLNQLAEQFQSQFESAIRAAKLESEIAKSRRLDKSKPKSLVDAHADAVAVRKQRSAEIFKNVPETGELDLKCVLESTYFFS